jgi:hypothetical protein
MTVPLHFVKQILAVYTEYRVVRARIDATGLPVQFRAKVAAGRFLLNDRNHALWVRRVGRLLWKKKGSRVNGINLTRLEPAQLI